MISWIIDDGPLGLLARHVGVDGFLRQDKLTLLIAEQTALDSNRHNVRRAFVQDCVLLKTFTFDLFHPASAILYEHFGQAEGPETKDLAERQALAWAMTEATDAIFVSLDKRACAEALAELGHGRVAHPYGLWWELHHHRYITKEQLEKLCISTQANQSSCIIPRRCKLIITS